MAAGGEWRSFRGILERSHSRSLFENASETLLGHATPCMFRASRLGGMPSLEEKKEKLN
jgi:hypothetical protein